MVFPGTTARAMEAEGHEDTETRILGAFIDSGGMGGMKVEGGGVGVRIAHACGGAATAR